MPRSVCARATARLTVKWLDHRYHHGRSLKTLRLIKLVLIENRLLKKSVLRDGEDAS
jgi:hypothetical protein